MDEKEIADGGGAEQAAPAPIVDGGGAPGAADEAPDPRHGHARAAARRHHKPNDWGEG